MIRLTVLAFVLALVVLGAMSVLGQSNDPCAVPVEVMPDYCWPQSSGTVGPWPTELPTATIVPTATAWVRPYPGPGPYPAPLGSRVLELNSFLKTFLAFISR
jgi:hypothetical protein